MPNTPDLTRFPAPGLRDRAITAATYVAAGFVGLAVNALIF